MKKPAEVRFHAGFAQSYALINANTGARLWSYTTAVSPFHGIESSPAVANGVVYFGSNDLNVYALNATSGAKLWSYTTTDSVGSSPAVVNGVVYVGSDTHYMRWTPAPAPKCGVLTLSAGSLSWVFVGPCGGEWGGL